MDSPQAENLITVTEVGPRDGLQSEDKFVPTDVKVKWINRLVDAGVSRIEFSSFVSPKAVPQLRDAAEVIGRAKRCETTIMAALVPNVRGAANAAEARVDEMVVFLSASESHNLKNVNRTVSESLAGFKEVARIAGEAGIPVHGAVATALGCPFEGEVPTERLVDIAKHYRNMGFIGIGLGDTTGMATPPVVERAVTAIRKAVPELPISLHFHNTRGIGLVNVMRGLELGVTRFESSFAGLGGCPFAPGATGNICTEDLVYLLHEVGYKTGIDLEALCWLARDIEGHMKRDLPGQVMKAGPRLQARRTDEVPTAME